jgi:hypothetical protein
LIVNLEFFEPFSSAMSLHSFSYSQHIAFVRSAL